MDDNEAYEKAEKEIHKYYAALEKGHQLKHYGFRIPPTDWFIGVIINRAQQEFYISLLFFTITVHWWWAD